MTFNLRHKIHLAAMFCASLFFSCTEVERGNPYDEDSNTFIVPQIVYGTPVSYEGETYQTVVIGSQTWMARNLNYNASGSKCYDNDPANCNKYGRLYDWATAMALPDSCNTNFCDSQISEKHRGICPSGWHIPKYYEWETLVDFVGGYDVAGMYLKAKSGWENDYFSDYYKGTGNGTDTYGFSALPGGNYEYALWWSAKEHDNGKYQSWQFSISSYRSGGGDIDIPFKTALNSVRCVKDY